MAARDKAKSGEYQGIPYESDEELYFLQWAWELKQLGFVSDIRRPQTYRLSHPLKSDYKVQLKTKETWRSQHFLDEHDYTPDFALYWTPKGVAAFVYLQTHFYKRQKHHFIGQEGEGEGEVFTLIEVKPTFDQNNMERAFRINQKWMWTKHGVFVNLVKPQILFKETWTPEMYLWTNKTKQPRKIQWAVRSITQFLKSIEA